MMTAKINNGTTETKTRLVRWKRRVLGFEGAAVTPYSPIRTEYPTSLSSIRPGRGAQDYASGREFLAHPSRTLGNRQPSHSITIAAGCCLSFDLSYAWRR